MSTINDIMGELQARCGHSNHTSEPVFALEVDPATPDSKLRNQDELIESFCAQESFPTDWLAILEDRIVAEPSHDDEIEELRATFQPDPGHRDVSLIVTALKLSTQTAQDCIVVTDDGHLTDLILGLRRDRRQVSLMGVQHSTSRVAPKLSLEILRELYVKCGTDHEFWNAAMMSFKIHYNGHQGQPGRKHHKTVLEFLNTIASDRRQKEALCMAQELGGLFGAENG